MKSQRCTTFRFYSKLYKANVLTLTKKDLKLRHALETKTTIKHAIKRIDRPFENHQQNRGKKLFVKDMQVLLHMLNHIPSLRIIGLMFDAARIH